MVRKISMAALIVVVLAATHLLQSTYAATYTVGDSNGWRIPSGNTTLYDDWADEKTFRVGDVLVFTFTTATHNVAEVREAAYDACNSTNPIRNESTGPARITLNSTGDHYFICTFPGHCDGGQKLKVEVGNGTTSTTPTSGVSSPPPSPSSSASSFVATLSLVFISTALVLLC